MTREEALSKLDSHARMRRLDERGRANGLYLTRHPDRRSIVVTAAPPFTPELRAHERVLLLDELLAHGPELFDYLEATDRTRAAVLAGERADGPSPPPSKPMPWWMPVGAAVLLVTIGGRILYVLVTRGLSGS